MITVDTLPDKITRGDLGRMLGQLGIELEDLIELHMESAGIWAKVYARNEAGSRYATNTSVAQHIVSIELVDG